MSSDIQINSNEVENALILTIKESKVFDEIIVNSINDQIQPILESNEKPNVILNFVNVTYISSSFLGKIVSMNKKIKAKSQKFILCGLNENIMEIFQITRLDKFFIFQPSVDEAVKNL